MAWKFHLKNRLSPILLIIFIIAWGAIQIRYFARTDIFTRSYDVKGHLMHINRVHLGHLIPKANECWECYHPPIYYITADLFLRLVRHVVISGARALQLFSLFLTSIYLFVSVLFLRKLIPQPRNVLLPLLLFLFWPSGFIHAIRISNDVAFYVFFALTFFFLFSWIKTKKLFPLIVASLFAFASPFTKANGILTLLSAGIIVAITLFENKSLPLKRFFLYLVIIVNVILFSCVSYYLMTKMKGHFTNAPFLTETLSVGNKWNHYFLKDAGYYFSTPFANSLDDLSGRQNAWIYLFKTALWGEFHFPAEGPARVATTLLLVVLLYMAGGFYLSFRIPEQKICWVPAITFLTGLIAYRWAFPISSSNDFRYIYPVIFPCSVFFMNFISALRQKNQMVLVGVGLVSMGGLLVSGVMTILS